MAEPITISLNCVFRWGAHWRHLANTIERPATSYRAARIRYCMCDSGFGSGIGLVHTPCDYSQYLSLRYSKILLPKIALYTCNWNVRLRLSQFHKGLRCGEKADPSVAMSPPRWLMVNSVKKARDQLDWRADYYTVKMSAYPRIFCGEFFIILTELVPYAFASVNRSPGPHAWASSFRRLTDTNVYGTGSVKIRKTRHKICGYAGYFTVSQ